MANIARTKVLVVFFAFFVCAACSLRKAERQKKQDWITSFKQAVFMSGMRVFYIQPDTAIRDISRAAHADIIGNIHVNRMADSLGKVYAHDLIAHPYITPLDLNGQPISNYFFNIYHSKALDSIAKAEYKKDSKAMKAFYKNYK